MNSRRVRYRLERGQWIGCERDSADRRGILISALRDRSAEMLDLYAGMSKSVDRICADCTDTELDVIAVSSAEPRMCRARRFGQLARPTGNGKADQTLRDRRSRSI